MKLIIVTLIILAAMIGSPLCSKVLRRKTDDMTINSSNGFVQFFVREFFLSRLKAYSTIYDAPIEQKGPLTFFEGQFFKTPVRITLMIGANKEKQELARNEIKLNKYGASKFSLPLCDSSELSDLDNYFLTFPIEKTNLYEEMSRNDGRNRIENVDRFLGGESLKTIIEMSKVVMEFHKSGIIHRNISLKNFLRMEDGRIVISNYKKAVLESEAHLKTEDKETISTYPWDYKQSSTGKKFDLTQKADVFGLAVSMITYLFNQFWNSQNGDYYKQMSKSIDGSKLHYERGLKIKRRIIEMCYGKSKNTDRKLLHLIFNKMMVADSHVLGIADQRISSKEVYQELKQIFPELVAEVEEKYNQNVYYCRTKEEYKDKSSQSFLSYSPRKKKQSNLPSKLEKKPSYKPPKKSSKDKSKNKFGLGSNEQHTPYSQIHNSHGNPPFNSHGNPPFNSHGNPPFNSHGNNPFNSHGNPPFNSHGNNPFNSHGNNPFNSHGNNPFNSHGNPPFNGHRRSNQKISYYRKRKPLY